MGGIPLRGHRAPGTHRGVRDAGVLRGLLHDVGHELTTLSYLVEAARGETSLPADPAWRLELLSLEISRLLEMVSHGLDTLDPSGAAEPVQVRDMACQVARLSGFTHPAEVTVLPGPEVTVETDPVLLWRVLSNVVGNAARAAGPAGHVTLALQGGNTTVIEVSDDGPGFGAGAPGMASLGLEVVASLLEECGGSLQVQSMAGEGTTARVLLPAADAVAGERRAGR